MSKPTVYATITIQMHSDGCYFDGSFTEHITEQAQRAYLEIARIVADHIGDSMALKEIRQDFAALNRKREGR